MCVCFMTRFQLDENAVPPMFVLQPITSQFPNYNDESDENSKKRDKVRFYFIANLLAKCILFFATAHVYAMYSVLTPLLNCVVDCEMYISLHLGAKTMGSCL